MSNTWRDVTNYSHHRARDGQPLAFEIMIAGVTVEVQHFANGEHGGGWYVSCSGGIDIKHKLLRGIRLDKPDHAKYAALRAAQERVQEIDRELGLAGGER